MDLLLNIIINITILSEVPFHYHTSYRSFKKFFPTLSLMINFDLIAFVAVFNCGCCYLTGATLHHHPARASGAHAARSRGAQEPGKRSQTTRGPLQANARRGLCDKKSVRRFFSRRLISGERNGKFTQKLGSGADDRGGLRHSLGREPSVRATR